jgi:hypothetical protein
MKRLRKMSIEAMALAIAIEFLVAPGAQASTPCSNSTLQGTYGALIKGTAHGLPFAALDVVTADGNGNFSGTGTVAYNGAITQNVAVAATYSINSDCSGTVNFTSPSQTQTLLITHKGDEVQFIRTDDPSDQVTGDAKRVDIARACSDKDLSGNLGATLGGEIAGNPFVALDSVTADGNGGFSGKGTISFDGAVSTVSFTASYSINPDCSGSISFSNGATQNLVVVGKDSEVRFIRTDNPDAVVTGIANELAP